MSCGITCSSAMPPSRLPLAIRDRAMRAGFITFSGQLVVIRSLVATAALGVDGLYLDATYRRADPWVTGPGR